jgi:hypothetical protein
MPFDTLVRNVDIFHYILTHSDFQTILMLSMINRHARKSVDLAQDRMAAGLRIYYPNLQNTMLKVVEYGDSASVTIDSSRLSCFRSKLHSSLSMVVGSILYMSIDIMGMHADILCTKQLARIRVRKWTLIQITPTCRDIQENYTTSCLTLQATAQNLSTEKDIFLIIPGMDTHRQVVSTRSLLALRCNQMCMTCQLRIDTYSCENVPEPQQRKLCKRCANEQMVTERALAKDWSVSKAHLHVLRYRTYRFYSRSGHYFITWIPKDLVCSYFKVSCWQDFMRQTPERARRQRQSYREYFEMP